MDIITRRRDQVSRGRGSGAKVGMHFQVIPRRPNAASRCQGNVAGLDLGEVIIQSIQNGTVGFQINIARLREDAFHVQITSGTAR